MLGPAERVAIPLVNRLAQRVDRQLGVLERRQPDGFDQLFLEGDHLLVQAMGLHDGVAHFGLGQLFAKAFDHHDGLFGAGDDQVEVAVFELLGGGEGDELAVDAAQPNGPDGAQKGHARQHERRR